VPDMLAMSWGDSRESGQNRQKGSRRGALSGTSSPVITHERVIGSLRSSMHKETTGWQLRQLGRQSGVLHRAAMDYGLL
jgi:hypothetical protein